MGVVDKVGPPIKNETPERSPYRFLSSFQSDTGLPNTLPFFGDDSHSVANSSSDTVTIGPLFDHENPQLLPYPSSTTIQSDGSQYNASLMTSPSYGSESFFEVRNYITEVCLPGHGSFALIVLSEHQR